MYNTKKNPPERRKKMGKILSLRETTTTTKKRKSRNVDNFPNYFSFHLEQFFMLDLK